MMTVLSVAFVFAVSRSKEMNCSSISRAVTLICSYARKISALSSATQPHEAKDEVLRSHLQLSLQLIQSGIAEAWPLLPIPSAFQT